MMYRGFIVGVGMPELKAVEWARRGAMLGGLYSATNAFAEGAGVALSEIGLVAVAVSAFSGAFLFALSAGLQWLFARRAWRWALAGVN